MQFYHPGKKYGNFCLMCKKCICTRLPNWERAIDLVTHVRFKTFVRSPLPAWCLPAKILNLIVSNPGSFILTIYESR